MQTQDTVLSFYFFNSEAERLTGWLAIEPERQA